MPFALSLTVHQRMACTWTCGVCFTIAGMGWSACIDEPFGAGNGASNQASDVMSTSESSASHDDDATSDWPTAGDSSTELPTTSASTSSTLPTDASDSSATTGTSSTSLSTHTLESESTTTSDWPSDGSSTTDPTSSSDATTTTSSEDESDFSQVVGLAVGGAHTCALDKLGRVRCWGSNADGQLGLPKIIDKIGDDEVPAQAPLLNLGEPARAIVAGDAHNCVLLNQGQVRCWGRNDAGQLGTARAAEDDVLEDPWRTDVALGGPALALAAGDDHTCALLDGGKVICWGAGDHGQLGYGNRENVGDDETPATLGAVHLAETAKVVAIACGSFHTCALFENGAFQCWGWGDAGALGTGNTESIGESKPPSSYPAIQLDDQGVDNLHLGYQFTCAQRLKLGWQCWGAGEAGQLGNAATEDVWSADANKPLALAVRGQATGRLGRSHLCLLLDGGKVQCWGAGKVLGTGTTESYGDDEVGSAAPKVALPAGASLVTSAFKHTCAIVGAGDVVCWGENDAGQLGYGHTRPLGDDEPVLSAGVVNLRN